MSTEAGPESVRSPGPVRPHPEASEADVSAVERPENLELLLPSGGVPLGFVREGESIFLIARERGARWPVEVLREGFARLRLRDGLVSGAPELLTSLAEKERVLALFRTAYGPVRFSQWYDHPARILRVHLGVAERLRPADPGAYYQWLAAEFDNVADDYDRHITGNRINRLLRDRSVARLLECFASRSKLLEIGCGSGMETLQLLDAGHELYCIDISERMLETVRAKARRAGVGERLRTRHLRAGSIAQLLDELGTGAFDGGYSTYGALNCEGDLRPIPPVLHSLIRGGGRFVAGVYNRWCAFELAGYALTGQLGRAFGRVHQPVPVGSSRFCVDVFAYSTGEFRRLFAPWFSVERVEGVPAFLPPSDLVQYAEKFGRHFARLARWDAAVGRRWPFRDLGDHFLMTFGRRPDV